MSATGTARPRTNTTIYADVITEEAFRNKGQKFRQELIRWAQALENSHTQLNVAGDRGTLFKDENFRLDHQGTFNAHGLVWVNLGNQYGDETLYTVHIHLEAFLKNLVTNGSVLYAVKQGANFGFKEQTVFAGWHTRTQRGGSHHTPTVKYDVCNPRNLDPNGICLALNQTYGVKKHKYRQFQDLKK